MKLELKHIAPYLPYQLKVWNEKDKYAYLLLALEEDNCTLESGDLSFYWCSPILRPLSNLNEKDFHRLRMISCRVQIEKDRVWYDGAVDLDTINAVNEYLLEHHFDVFSLINKGLAIDFKHPSLLNK